MTWEFNFGHIDEVFPLENNSIAIKYSDQAVEKGKNEPMRICQAMLKSREGETITIGVANHSCLGGNYWCGLSDELTERQINHVVETEHLYASRAAFFRTINNAPPQPHKLGQSVLFSPLRRSEFKPDLVLLFVKPRNASELLSLAIRHNGIPFKDLFINGATCRTAIANPVVTGQLGISFVDMAGRTRYPSGYKDEELILSFPLSLFETVVKNYEEKRVLPKYIPAQ